MKEEIIPIEVIENKIYIIRGQKVMLDRDLAILYGIQNIQLKRQVRRNFDRFPVDFMFTLTKEEIEQMVCHFGVPSMSYFGGSVPFAFTEQGVAMLSSILNSKRAVQVNIMIIRAFVKLRLILFTHKEFALKLAELERKYEGHDVDIRQIFDAIKQLMKPPAGKTKRIGFRADSDV
jgi:hypothetical protein